MKEDPTRCAIIADKPVPYCIKEVPSEGWEVKSIIPPKDFIYWSEAQTFTSTGINSCMILIIENHSISYFDYLPTFRSAFEETYLSVVDETHFTVNGFPAIILFIHQDSRYDGYRILFGDAHEKIQAT
ncbi:MAG: hypothetical protein LBB85_09390 [Dysgonamonadaceae bacterium]|nr:hypothetical protein [Dysgonamonadaceae bacterium]